MKYYITTNSLGTSNYETVIKLVKDKLVTKTINLFKNEVTKKATLFDTKEEAEEILNRAKKEIGINFQIFMFYN